MAKRWKKDELTYMKRYSAKRRVAELAERFGADPDEVRAKLDELALRAADHGGKPDAAIEPLEKGIKALYGGSFKQAEKHLAQAEASAEDSIVAARARRYLAVARQRQATDDSSSPDPYLEAVYERNRGNIEAALEICSRGGRQSKDERFAHLAASLHSLRGDTDKAAKFLKLAIQVNPRNRVLAYHDPDFASLRKDPKHAELFAAYD